MFYSFSRLLILHVIGACTDMHKAGARSLACQGLSVYVDFLVCIFVSRLIHRLRSPDISIRWASANLSAVISDQKRLSERGNQVWMTLQARDEERLEMFSARLINGSKEKLWKTFLFCNRVKSLSTDYSASWSFLEGFSRIFFSFCFSASSRTFPRVIKARRDLLASRLRPHWLQIVESREKVFS